MARGEHLTWGDGGRLDVVELTDMLQSVLVDNADAILVIADDGTILAVNPASEELFDQFAGELVGSTFGYPVSPDRPAELDIPRNGDVHIAEMHVARTRWRGEEVNVATLRDITERRGAERRLRDFVSIASHELRTPATSIAGFATTLIDHYDELAEDERRHSLEVINRQARRLVALASDLLELARIEDGSMDSFPRVVSLRSCVDAAVESAGLEDVRIVDCDDLDLFVDDEHLIQILVNYLTNAGKYGAAPITVRARRSGRFAEVIVSDEGDGVPRDFRPRLFERFARAATGGGDKVGGTGLGLALVTALAAINRGSAWYRPNEPKGSQFGVSLPVGTP